MAVIRVSTNSEFANSNVIIPQDKYFCGYVCSDLGKDGPTKTDEFLEKFQTAS